MILLEFVGIIIGTNQKRFSGEGSLPGFIGCNSQWIAHGIAPFFVSSWCQSIMNKIVRIVTESTLKFGSADKIT